MNKIILPMESSSPLGERDRFVFSSRVRIARNVDALPFPACLTPEQKKQLEESLSRVIKKIYGSSVQIMTIENMDESGIRALEAGLLTTGAFSQYGGIFFADKKGGWVLLPNEKDHLRLFAIEYGTGLTGIYQRLAAVLASLEPDVHFAFHPSFGYLTSYADDAGTALSLSYLMNLTGVEMTGRMDSLAAVCEETGYRLTPCTGVRGSQLFFLKNLGSYGLDEIALIKQFEGFTDKVLREEQSAREKLFSSTEDLDFLNAQLMDAVQAPGLSYHSLLESVALADMLDGVSYKISSRVEWRCQMFTLHPHGELFQSLSEKEEIESLRAECFRKAFKKYLRSK